MFLTSPKTAMHARSLSVAIIFSAMLAGAVNLSTARAQRSGKPSKVDRSQEPLKSYRFTVRGRAVDQNGRPVARAVVVVDAGLSKTWEDFTYSVESDESGNFLFSDGEQSTRNHVRYLYVTGPLPDKTHSPILPPFNRIPVLTQRRFASRVIQIKENAEIDVGDVPIQVEYGSVDVHLRDVDGRSLDLNEEDWRYVWLRLRNEQGRIVRFGSFSIDDIENSVDVANSSARIALPEGTWVIEASLREDKGPWLTSATPIHIDRSNKDIDLTLRQAQLLADDQAQTVSYCELVNNKSRFYGRLVRVTATLLTQLDSVSLYDSACPNEGVEPVLDCDDDEECSRLQKLLDENSDFDGDVSRVETVLVGRLQQPTDPKQNSRSEFVFKTIEETRKIPSYVPKSKNRRPDPILVSFRNDHGRIQEPELISRSSRSRDAINREEEPPLLQAAQTGDEAKVKELLLAGASVNIRDSFGNTALMRASNQSHSHVVKLLIASHAAVNAANKNGFSALMYAADQADLESVQALVEAGANVNAKSTAGFTPLYMVLRSLCEHEQNCTRTKSIMELLISKGADVNAQTEDGDTILMAASELGHISTVNILLKSGAEVNRTNSTGQTALCLAEKEENDEIASRLRSLGAEGCSGAPLRAADRPSTSSDPGLKLREAVRAGNEATVKDLLAAGADIETVDAIGYTPLILAAEWSHPNVVKLLIDSHARVNASGTNGFTALMFAAEHGDLESVERLMAAGADVRARTKFGNLTALTMAFAERCSSERACARVKSIAELLILKGADVNAETDDQGTALMNAVGVRNVAAVRVLLSAGADVNKRDASGDTALCIAIREGYSEIAAVLRAGGAKECERQKTISDSSPTSLLVQQNNATKQSTEFILIALLSTERWFLVARGCPVHVIPQLG